MAKIQWYVNRDGTLPEIPVIAPIKSSAELVLEQLDRMAAEIADRLGMPEEYASAEAFLAHELAIMRDGLESMHSFREF